MIFIAELRSIIIDNSFDLDFCDYLQPQLFGLNQTAPACFLLSDAHYATHRPDYIFCLFPHR